MNGSQKSAFFLNPPVSNGRTRKNSPSKLIKLKSDDFFQLKGRMIGGQIENDSMNNELFDKSFTRLNSPPLILSRNRRMGNSRVTSGETSSSGKCSEDRFCENDEHCPNRDTDVEYLLDCDSPPSNASDLQSRLSNGPISERVDISEPEDSGVCHSNSKEVTDISICNLQNNGTPSNDSNALIVESNAKNSPPYTLVRLQGHRKDAIDNLQPVIDKPSLAYAPRILGKQTTGEVSKAKSSVESSSAAINSSEMTPPKVIWPEISSVFSVKDAVNDKRKSPFLVNRNVLRNSHFDSNDKIPGCVKAKESNSTSEPQLQDAFASKNGKLLPSVENDLIDLDLSKTGKLLTIYLPPPSRKIGVLNQQANSIETISVFNDDGVAVAQNSIIEKTNDQQSVDYKNKNPEISSKFSIPKITSIFSLQFANKTQDPPLSSNIKKLTDSLKKTDAVNTGLLVDFPSVQVKGIFPNRSKEFLNSLFLRVIRGGKSAAIQNSKMEFLKKDLAECIFEDNTLRLPEQDLKRFVASDEQEIEPFLGSFRDQREKLQQHFLTSSSSVDDDSENTSTTSEVSDEEKTGNSSDSEEESKSSSDSESKEEHSMKSDVSASEKCVAANEGRKKVIELFSNEKPDCTLLFIAALILKTHGGKLQSSEFYDAVIEMFPYFKNTKEAPWKKSIRKALSSHKLFRKCKRAKQATWELNPIHEHSLNDYFCQQRRQQQFDALVKSYEEYRQKLKGSKDVQNENEPRSPNAAENVHITTRSKALHQSSIWNKVRSKTKADMRKKLVKLPNVLPKSPHKGLNLLAAIWKPKKDEEGTTNEKCDASGAHTKLEKENLPDRGINKKSDLVNIKEFEDKVDISSFEQFKLTSICSNLYKALNSTSIFQIQKSIPVIPSGKSLLLNSIKLFNIKTHATMHHEADALRLKLRRDNYVVNAVWWLVQKGFILKCPPCGLCGYITFTLDRNPKFKEGFSYTCDNPSCLLTQEVVFPELLRSQGLDPWQLVVLVFHWVCGTDVGIISRDVGLNVDSVWAIYRRLQDVCTRVMEEKGRLGSPAGTLVEMSAAKLGSVFVLGALERRTSYVRLAALPQAEAYSCKSLSIGEDFLQKGASLVTQNEMQSDLMPSAQKVAACSDCTDPRDGRPHTLNVQRFMAQTLVRMFGQLDHQFLSWELVQGLVQEASWRQRYGRNAAAAFNSIWQHLRDASIEEDLTIVSAGNLGTEDFMQNMDIDLKKRWGPVGQNESPQPKAPPTVEIRDSTSISLLNVNEPIRIRKKLVDPIREQMDNEELNRSTCRGRKRKRRTYVLPNMFKRTIEAETRRRALELAKSFPSGSKQTHSSNVPSPKNVTEQFFMLVDTTKEFLFDMGEETPGDIPENSDRAFSVGERHFTFHQPVSIDEDFQVDISSQEGVCPFVDLPHSSSPKGKSAGSKSKQRFKHPSSNMKSKSVLKELSPTRVFRRKPCPKSKRKRIHADGHSLQRVDVATSDEQAQNSVPITKACTPLNLAPDTEVPRERAFVFKGKKDSVEAAPKAKVLKTQTQDPTEMAKVLKPRTQSVTDALIKRKASRKKQRGDSSGNATGRPEAWDAVIDFDNVYIMHLCIECGERITSEDHFNKLFQCSECPRGRHYATLCPKAFFEHRSWQLFGWSMPRTVEDTECYRLHHRLKLVDPWRCTCGYTCDNGNFLATHMVECGKKTCSLDVT